MITTAAEERWLRLARTHAVETRGRDMTYEAAMIVISKPGYFSHDDCWKAAQFIIKTDCPPIHIKCDHKSNQNRAQNVAFVAFEGIRWTGRWPDVIA